MVWGVGAQDVRAQRGRIRVHVVDSIWNEPLNGATVQIEQTKQGAYTKEYGNAIFTDVHLGEYSLLVKYVGYLFKRIEHVKVTAATTTEISVLLVVWPKADPIIYDPSRSTTPQHRGRFIVETVITEGYIMAGEIEADFRRDALNALVSSNQDGAFDHRAITSLNEVQLSDPVHSIATPLQTSLSRYAFSDYYTEGYSCRQQPLSSFLDLMTTFSSDPASMSRQLWQIPSGIRR